MKIFYDNINFYIQKSGGVSVVFYELLKRVLKREDYECYFIDYGESDNTYYRRLNKNQTQRIKESTFLLKLKRLFPIKTDCAVPHIFHSTYFTYTSNKHAINITTVHDFTESKVKQSLSTKLRTWLQLHVIKHSNVVVCISESTKKDLLKLLPNFDQSKIRIIYNGVSDVYHVSSTSTTDLPFCKNKYVIYVGDRSRYKNFHLVLEAIKDTAYSLVMVGSPLSHEEEVLINSKLPFNRYKCMGFVSEETLNILYNNALVLAYPSLYEGFGLPVLEAQKAGCPVIAYNSTSIPEIIGNTPLLMAECTKEELLGKIKLLEDSSIRESIITLGLENSKRFSWDIMANNYMTLYEECLSSLSTCKNDYQ